MLKSKVAPGRDMNRQRRMNKIYCLKLLGSAIGKVSLAVLIFIFLERTYRIMHKFLSDPTYFETHYVPQYHAHFPAVTVCPLTGYKLAVLQVIHGIKLFLYYFGHEKIKIIGHFGKY